MHYHIFDSSIPKVFRLESLSGWWAQQQLLSGVTFCKQVGMIQPFPTGPFVVPCFVDSLLQTALVATSSLIHSLDFSFYKVFRLERLSGWWAQQQLLSGVRFYK